MLCRILWNLRGVRGNSLTPTLTLTPALTLTLTLGLTLRPTEGSLAWFRFDFGGSRGYCLQVERRSSRPTKGLLMYLFIYIYLFILNICTYIMVGLKAFMLPVTQKRLS